MEPDGRMQQAVIGWDLSRVVFRDLERTYPVVERGEGIYLYDTKGRKYIDGSGGSSVVTSIGHGNKRVAGDHILLAPPFIITESQVDDVVAILDEAIGVVEKALPSDLHQ